MADRRGLMGSDGRMSHMCWTWKNPVPAMKLDSQRCLRNRAFLLKSWETPQNASAKGEVPGGGGPAAPAHGPRTRSKAHTGDGKRPKEGGHRLPTCAHPSLRSALGHAWPPRGVSPLLAALPGTWNSLFNTPFPLSTALPTTEIKCEFK